MRRFFVVILSTLVVSFVVQGHAKERSAYRAHDSHAFLDKVVDQLVNKLIVRTVLKSLPDRNVGLHGTAFRTPFQMTGQHEIPGTQRMTHAGHFPLKLPRSSARVHHLRSALLRASLSGRPFIFPLPSRSHCPLPPLAQQRKMGDQGSEDLDLDLEGLALPTSPMQSSVDQGSPTAEVPEVVDSPELPIRPTTPDPLLDFGQTSEQDIWRRFGGNMFVDYKWEDPDAVIDAFDNPFALNPNRDNPGRESYDPDWYWPPNKLIMSTWQEWCRLRWLPAPVVFEQTKRLSAILAASLASCYVIDGILIKICNWLYGYPDPLGAQWLYGDIGGQVSQATGVSGIAR